MSSPAPSSRSSQHDRQRKAALLATRGAPGRARLARVRVPRVDRLVRVHLAPRRPRRRSFVRPPATLRGRRGRRFDGMPRARLPRRPGCVRAGRVRALPSRRKDHARRPPRVLRRRAGRRARGRAPPHARRRRGACPGRRSRRVPLYVWATAGLRAIDEDAQTNLWNAVARVARDRTPFFVADKHLDPHRAHFRVHRGRRGGLLRVVGGESPLRSEPARRRRRRTSRRRRRVGRARRRRWLRADRRPRRDALAASAFRKKAPADVSIASLRDAVYVKSYLGYGATRVESRVKSEIAAAAKSRGDAVATYPCGFLGREEPRVTDDGRR